MMMNEANVKETFAPAVADIAKRILASPVAGCLKEHSRREMEEVAGGTRQGRHNPVSASTLTAYFAKAGTSVDLYLRTEATDRRGSILTDNDGNEWLELRISCEVNWPAHGGSAIAVALARVNLYRDVAMLAAEVEAEFSGYRSQVFHTLYRTAEQVKAEKAEEAKRQAESKTRNVIAAHRRGMQVGPVRVVSAAVVDGILQGIYEVTFEDGKRYTLEVKPPRSELGGAEVIGTITRTA